MLSLLATAFLVLPGRRLLGLAIPMAALTAAFAVIYLWRGRFKTILTHGGIKVRGYFNHHVPWQEVARFDVVRYGAPRSMAEEGIPLDSRPRLGQRSRVTRGGRVSRLAAVAVIRVNGQRLQLRAPWVTAWQFDPELDNKVAVMERWWREHSVPQRPPG